MAHIFERPVSRNFAEAPVVTRSASGLSVQSSRLNRFTQFSQPDTQTTSASPSVRSKSVARAVFIALVTFALLIAATTIGYQPRIAHAAPEDDNLVDPTQRADHSFIHDTNIESLSEQGSIYNDHEVQVFGEVIGDCIAATDEGYSWITLTVTDAEDKTSISVLISDEQAGQIDHYGKYGVTGTILQVLGEFHQACSEHDGLADIHCTDSSVLARGVEHPDDFNVGDFAPGIVAILIGLALMLAFYAARERMR